MCVRCQQVEIPACPLEIAACRERVREGAGICGSPLATRWDRAFIADAVFVETPFEFAPEADLVRHGLTSNRLRRMFVSPAALLESEA